MKEKISKKTKFSTKAIVILLFFLIVGFIIAIFDQYNNYNNLIKIESEILESIDKLHEQKSFLEKKLKHQGSDDFIEEIARKELNMIKPNEMLIINEN